jgi:hypothetical protein
MFGSRPQTNNDLISPSQAKLSIDQQLTFSTMENET